MYIPSDGIKRHLERETFTLLPIASRPANSIHIRVTFNAVTRYKPFFRPLLLYLERWLIRCPFGFIARPSVRVRPLHRGSRC